MHTPANLKNEIIKNFTIGFMPILVYIIADAIWGITIGLIVAIISGVIEMGISFYKEKKIEYFIILDIGLLIVLGLISLLLQSDIFIKVKPALINFIFLILLFLTGFTKRTLLIEMATRRMKNIRIDQEQIAVMQTMIRKFFYLILIHTILIIYSAYYMSTAAWGFISGGLFYIFAGGLVVYEWIKMWKKRKTLEAEEWFDLVNPNGEIIGQAPRSQVHGNPELLHPVVHVHILNSNDEIYLQKRANNKQVQPGKWDSAVGGHVNRGEAINTAAQRESKEELGLENIQLFPIARYLWKTDFESELVHVFKGYCSGKIEFNQDEISDGKFWRPNKIKKNIGKNLFTPNFEFEYLMLQKMKLL